MFQNTLQLVLFSTLSLLTWASVIPNSRSYLTPAEQRIYYIPNHSGQQYYPIRPLITNGAHYQPGWITPENQGNSDFIFIVNSGQNHYYNPDSAGSALGHYKPGIGGVQYLKPTVSGGAGIGSNSNQTVGAGADNNNTVTGSGVNGLVQADIVKPKAKPLILNHDGYVYGNKN